MNPTDKHLLVARLMEQTSHMIKQRMCDINDEASKLTLKQLLALDLIGRKERLRMADIATELNITPASATSLVNRLVVAGWLTRSEDSTDRRSVWIQLHPDRKTQVDIRRQQRRNRIIEFTQVLSDEQLQQLADILQTLVARNS